MPFHMHTDPRPGAPAKVERYHHGDLRRALLDEARRHVDAKGAHDLSLAGLAKVLGVSSAAPYRHFADRGDLLAQVAQEGFHEFTAEVDAAITSAAPNGRLAALVHRFVAFGVRHAGLYQLMFASPLLASAKEASPLKIAAQSGFQRLMTVIPDTCDNRAARALRLWVSLHGVVMLAASGLLENNPTGVSLQSLLEDLVH